VYQQSQLQSSDNPYDDPSCSPQQAFETPENKEGDENGSAPVTRGSAPGVQVNLEKLGSKLGGMTKDTQQRILVSGDGFDELGKEEKPSRVNSLCIVHVNSKKIYFFNCVLFKKQVFNIIQ
jgi:hypothetical protein